MPRYRSKPNDSRIMSDLLTREMVEVTDRFTINYLERAVMRRMNPEGAFKPAYKLPIQELPCTTVLRSHVSDWS